MEIQKFEYLENKKSFLDQIKSSFIVFEGLSFGEKIEIWWKQRTQALTKSKPGINIKVILTFSKLILTINNFVFNGINYLQKKGCAMGTKCAPSSANIFIGWFEERFIFNFWQT